VAKKTEDAMHARQVAAELADAFESEYEATGNEQAKQDAERWRRRAAGLVKTATDSIICVERLISNVKRHEPHHEGRGSRLRSLDRYQSEPCSFWRWPGSSW
jgi:hypothetical protein